MEEKNNNNEKKKFNVGLKISLVIGLILVVIGFVLFFMRDPTLSMVSIFVLFVGFALTMVGLIPLMAKLNIKIGKHIVEQNKDDLAELSKYGVDINKKVITDKQEDLTDIANMKADIAQDAVKKTAKSASEGWEDGQGNAKFCANCGQKISASAKFCPNCGQKIDE